MKLLVTNEPRFSAVVYFNEIRREFRKEYTRLKKIELERLEAAGGGRLNYSEISSRARANVLNGYVDQINSILGSDYKLTSADYNRHFENQRLLPFPIIKDLKGREHAILAERLPVDSPIQIYTDTARYYPYGDSAAHLLGYVGSNFDEIDTEGVPGDDLQTFSFVGKIGRSGIEKAFDSKLQGRSGAKIWVVDLDGYQYDNVADVRPKKGSDVVASIDIELQQAVEDAFGERKGAAVALDVKTGEVLAMVSRPSYDPNLLSPYMTYKVSSEITRRGAWLNRATQGLYPPGSPYKLMTAAAGLMTGVIDENTVKTCDGGLKVGSRIFPCNKRSGHGNVTLEDAIAHSCNVYFYETALEAGIEALSSTAKDFGLDSRTGIELKEDYSRRTVVSDPAYKKKYRPYDGPWTGGDTANASIGQGYQLQTPLQMACMTASLARGETRTRPSVVHDRRASATSPTTGGEARHEAGALQGRHRRNEGRRRARHGAPRRRRGRFGGGQERHGAGSRKGRKAHPRVDGRLRTRRKSADSRGGCRRGRGGGRRGGRAHGGADCGDCAEKVFRVVGGAESRRKPRRGRPGRKPPRFSSAASYDKACQNSLSGGYFEPIIFKTPRGEAYFI